jgi:dimethylaniline monooxygenase (N-oxide forming)
VIHLTLLELPAYLDQDQACRYIQAYADHFDLNHHVKFKTTVKLIKRDEELERWQVSVSSERGEEISNFDKIVICTGLNMKPCTPHFQGAEKFEGKVIHAQAFKRSIRRREWLKHADV